MKKLIAVLKDQKPQINFVESDEFRWSPKNQTVYYVLSDVSDPSSRWTLLHEFAHGLLEHKNYQSDVELIKLESQAWDKAKEVGQKLGYDISDDHIEDCLDTYRDWLHLRSRCPICENHSLQRSSGDYYCFNCEHTWTVTNSRFCRPYRSSSNKKTPLL